MTALLIATWLCLPIAPLNPMEEDTLASIGVHLSAGLSNPNGIVTAGPTVSAKYEMLVIHPFMVRGTMDYKYGRVTSNLFPKGNLYSMMLGLDAIYYRGTNHLIGYIGFGFVYAFHHFDAFRETTDSLFRTEGVTSIDLQQDFGYRLTLGLRYHRVYSFEIGVVELHPDFKKVSRDPVGREARYYRTTRTGSFMISLGYLFEL